MAVCTFVLLNVYMHLLVLFPYRISLMHGHGVCNMYRYNNINPYPANVENMVSS